MEIVLAIAIGVLTGAGVWLLLRPRTFQIIMGLSLLSYAVNLFIFSMGSLSINDEPVIVPGLPQTLDYYTDPLPQALVLTAIVIGFAMTALFLVVLMAARGLFGNDHVDGYDDAPGGEAPAYGPAEPRGLPPAPQPASQPASQPEPRSAPLVSEPPSTERSP